MKIEKYKAFDLSQKIKRRLSSRRNAQPIKYDNETLFDSCLCCCHACDRHTVGAAAYVVHAQ